MKKLILSVVLFACSCGNVAPVKVNEKGAAMLDWFACSDTLRKYVLALVPNMDDLDPTQMARLEELATVVDNLNQALAAAGKDYLAINRGYLSTPDISAENDPYLCSKHMDADSIDVDDFDGSLYDWMIQNNAMTTFDFYIADKSLTPGLIHIQKYAPPSGDRVFTP